jgi:hypothetical protein
MRKFTKLFIHLTLIIPLAFFQNSVLAQFDCAGAQTLVLDITCIDETSVTPNSGDPTGNDLVDGNVCSTNYSGGDDYIFTYTATSTDALDLDLFATNTWTGLMVTEGCPTSGTCIASSTSSASDESLVTPSLTNGSTYYIHISTWPSPQSSGPFCLNAALISPPMPPVNDDCAGALALTVNSDLACGLTTPGTINLATASPEDPAACSGTEDDDVWFSFVATATSHQIDLINIANGTTDLYHSLWEGGCGSLTLVSGSCSDPNSSTPSGLTIGNTYYLRVYSWTSTTGQTTTFDVCIGSLPPPPSNDACAGAVVMMDGDFSSGNTVGATNVEALTACSNGGGGGICAAGGTGTTDFTEGVWFVYTSGGAGESVVFDSDNVGTDFDTEILVFEGACGSLVCVGGDDDGGDGSGHNFDSQFCWETTGAGIDYYMYLDGHSGATGNYNVHLTILAPANDECATAAVLAMNTTGSLIDQSFGGATASGIGAEACDGGSTPTPADVWYSINTDSDGGNLIVVVEPGPNSDIVVAIYDACGAPIPEQCVDLGGNGGIETINFNANFKGKGNTSSTRDADYFVRVYEKVASGELFEIGAQGAALPIILGTFDAHAEKRANRVKWTTLSEINSDYIELQSSPNGSTKWENIGVQSAKGESNSRMEYELLDFNPYEITYYRLNAVDKDGKAEYSRVINVRRSDVLGKMTLSPNPANANISLQTTSNIEEIGTVRVIDMTGKMILRESVSLRKGLNTYSFDLIGLNAGIYLFTLQTEEGTKVEKIVKQ